ncbi:MAG: hypothetical protein KJN82_02795 [Bacteroidia bacterium]|nr:hypothetical protein [Bacteroidia bacterium]
MKKIFYYLLFMILFSTCSKNNADENCNFLLNIGVNAILNLNLPQYSPLGFISNSVYVPGYGNKGIIVINTGTGFAAWDASDPNHSPNSCSTLEIVGVEGVCGCIDENTYSLYTGQPLSDPNLLCGLKAYRVEQSGNTLLISN